MATATGVLLLGLVDLVRSLPAGSGSAVVLDTAVLATVVLIVLGITPR